MSQEPIENQENEDEALALDLAWKDWPSLSPEERQERFRSLVRVDAEELFLSLSSEDQSELLLEIPELERRSWMRLLPPDDAADLIQASDEEFRPSLLQLLDERSRSEVAALLAYKEDQAGGLMSPRFPRIRAEMSVREALTYVRIQATDYLESLRYIYVLGIDQSLHGVVSLRTLFAAPPDKRVDAIMEKDLITVRENMEQEELSRVFSQSGLNAIPVVDENNRMKGVVTVDDMISVVEEEATEDIQKMGAQSALDAPYLQTSFFEMVRKRVGWLAILFVGSTFTASAIEFYEAELERAIVLTLFIPLIIASGGNSGSQASTLVIRAMALGQIRLRDWWRVLFRESFVGLSLGVLLGVLGFLRVMVWPGRDMDPFFLYWFLALTVSLSVVLIVLWGTVVGCMLPFALRRLGLDPATASAPFVATFVDVTGLIIYFAVASAVFLQVVA
ncbi:MAG: magnesium transporter [Bradymonadales bacterium]|nr:MAG: magnesium transporter [Bradymonadales bacterium]